MGTNSVAAMIQRLIEDLKKTPDFEKKSGNFLLVGVELNKNNELFGQIETMKGEPVELLGCLQILKEQIKGLEKKINKDMLSRRKTNETLNSRLSLEQKERLLYIQDKLADASTSKADAEALLKESFEIMGNLMGGTNDIIDRLSKETGVPKDFIEEKLKSRGFSTNHREPNEDDEKEDNVDDDLKNI